MLKILTELNGVSGNETNVCDFILSQISAVSDDVIKDSMGNLIIFKRGKKPSGLKIAVFAHMDECGLIVTDITDDGYIKFSTVGAVNEKILLAKHVVIGKDNVPGIIGIKAVHLQTADERKKNVPVSDMYIDIGAKSKDKALKSVCKGDYIAFKSDYIKLGNTKFKAKAVSSRIGCDIIMKLLQGSYDENIYFCFTVQEEVGMRGIKILSKKIKPDISFVFDAVESDDFPNAVSNKETIFLGKGPVISYYSKAVSYDRDLIGFIKKIADDSAIQIQYNIIDKTENGSSELQYGSSGCRVCRISLPCRHVHTPYSVAEIGDCVCIRRLASAAVSNISDFSC